MNCSFIRRTEGNDSLILIFTGWSASPALYGDIDIAGWDLLVVSDYENDSFDESLLEGYATIYLYAWSLGVTMAAHTLNPERITRAFAINGTEHPADDTLGIPERIYFATADNLDERNLKKFQRRMFASAEAYRNSADLLQTSQTIGTLREQLYNVERMSHEYKDGFPWTRAYISTEDAIFPPQAQNEAWSRKESAEIFSLPPGHFPDMRKIIRSTVPDPSRIGRRFHDAYDTYDDYATAQHTIAENLADRLADYAQYGDIRSILEIGQGTGLFSRLYAERLHPESITYIDIYPTDRFSLAQNEEYIVADAERWLRDSSGSWNAIVSASAIQWFADIRRFIDTAANKLTPNGILAISTFGKGNLAELDAIRKSPIVYADENQWMQWLNKDFTDISVSSESLTIAFENSRDVLLHLRNTGVGGASTRVEGNGKRGLMPPEFNSIRTLTYRPLYILARLRK